ncbi:phosphoenolpyruvate synthase [Panacibacter sp. DH6]|uniref:Phosphoenolpyruvate synthase n=1 Tax=Panacibacter microcysteis TaxID=2793269 RepID=A0A931E3V0_9BACT|nr:phosphoenolpyruvate synthase [Panacibacter microcysteis]MBG9374659.1 phosphoenolpyruvate synthase [Panacibacter microcysteis]
MSVFVKRFNNIAITDVPVVGGKNASLGEMYANLASKGIKVPDGFATTAEAFQYFLSYNNLHKPIGEQLAHLDKKHFSNLAVTGSRIRELVAGAALPGNLMDAIAGAYAVLGNNTDIAVAVRSSATAEDLPQASFAGQHESYLNVSGKGALLKAVKKCFASLYTDRAIKYREDNGFAHEKVSLSVGVQKMVRSDLASSGVVFTLEPESGFRNIIHISGVWGLGENIVQGAVTPDEFFVFKPTLLQRKNAIIKRKMGAKAKTMIYGSKVDATVVNIDTPVEKRRQFVLNDDEVTTIAGWANDIEAHYGKPMDIEWAKDGETNELFIIQARPETVHSQQNALVIKEYRILTKGKLLAQGEAIGSKLATGVARILKDPAEAYKLNEGEIVITDTTSPDWDPVLKKAAAIVTDKGGRTSHASIVARELGVPAVVGCAGATACIKDGALITVSCCEGETGFIYEGAATFEESLLDFTNVRKPVHTKVMLILADPDKAFKLSFYPNDGVGLLRIEFIITHAIQVHPMALARYNDLQDDALKKAIDAITDGYADKQQFFIDKLAEGVATIAAAFYPKEVIVRMSDFKTNEYANLIGGKYFEPAEENPMLGFRGASRYYNDLYKDGFAMECAAIKKVRDEMGFTNVKVMIPFCRTIDEGRKVLGVMKQHGLAQHVNSLQVYVMAEIPANIILATGFAAIFDGFSIGSNDLTQLTLGIDRDSAIISDLFSEENEAVKEMIAMMISKAKTAGSKVGLCGQAPSDFPAFAGFLVEHGIDSISFNPDALLKGTENILKAEGLLMVTH